MPLGARSLLRAQSLPLPRTRPIKTHGSCKRAQPWNWSQEQISAYPSTSEGKAAETDIIAVAAAFGSANPGFASALEQRFGADRVAAEQRCGTRRDRCRICTSSMGYRGLDAEITRRGRRLARNHFVGPRQSPYEPWHYAYVPALTPLR